ncbi:hypothetical protein ASE14_05425 [Agromyces sp. Root81]|uniref:polysaccharide biosynthesis C-terminal domain-containing protein n=1 Tax=Agromyces sp. Root81 TaxID=1736601 RepID=UPI000700BC24|nr:polysaccharide biosynthesis C-terminal domain-containing protein [Agromyces sp. Root81]KRC60461.1 hypothetical protein ASE14_05425 [Agromyces sp. Root81]
MKGLQRLVRATGGYGASVVVSGIVSIAVIPAVIILAGADAWAAIAIAQAVAGFAFVIAVFGWGVTGPTRVAALPSEQRGGYYLGSLVSRGWLTLLVTPPSIVLAALMQPDYVLLVALTVTSGIIAALGAGWFFVGERSPTRFLLLDTLPRTVGTIVGAGALMLTHDAVWFAGVQGAGALCATVLSSISILRRYRGWRLDLRPVPAFRRLRGQTPEVAMSATSAVYVNLPIIVVQLMLPQAVATFALAERIMRLALYSTRPIVQMAQGYVPATPPEEQLRRARLVVKAALVLGLLGTAAYTLLGPWIGDLLSGGELSIDLALAASFGLALGALLASQLTGFACLTAFERTRTLAVSTIAGAVVGGILLVPLAFLIGLPGVALAMAAAELAVLAVQLHALRSVLRPPVDGAKVRL